MSLQAMTNEHFETPYKNQSDFYNKFTSTHYTAAANAARNFDPKPLEYVVSQYKSSSDLPKDVVKQITSHLNKIADYIGLTKKAIVSDSLRKLRKQQNIITVGIQEVEEQIDCTYERINLLDGYIYETSEKLTECWQNMLEKEMHLRDAKIKLEKLEKENDDLFSSNEAPHIYLQENHFKFVDEYEILQQDLEQYQSIVQTYKQSRDSFAADKFHERLSHSILKSDLIVLQSLDKQIHYYIKRHEQAPILSTLSRVKLDIGRSYSLENELIADEEKQRTQYNNALSKLPSFSQLRESNNKHKRERTKLRG